MMTEIQYLLGKLAEEASELAQIALKTQQFGLNEQCPGLDLTNLERIEQEYNDVLGVINMIYLLIDKDGLADGNIYENKEQIHAKIVKVKKYMEYSRQLGMVE
jgi:NTP pyrophosphatase (non-canonical NTP hydrolase)